MKITSTGHLPPHHAESELFLLSCCLQKPQQWMNPVLDRIGQARNVFYVNAHELVWEAMADMFNRGQPLDLITLSNKMGLDKTLPQVGGFEFLSTLEQAAPSVENLPNWLDVVWEKFVARDVVNLSTQVSTYVSDRGGITESDLHWVDNRYVQMRALWEKSGQVEPQHLREPETFRAEYLDYMFHKARVEPGLDLPFGFPLKFRRHEITLFLGENGAGKTSLLSQIALKLALQNQKICIASMEVPPHVTLGILTRQLLARKLFDESSEADCRLLNEALDFLNDHFVLYDFLGITQWATLLDVFRYAHARLHCGIFTLDSVMRIGIADDDYAEQGRVAAQMAGFCVKTGSHMIVVNHLNKNDGKIKQRARGSMQWTDSVDNVISLERNEKKQKEVENLRDQLEKLHRSIRLKGGVATEQEQKLIKSHEKELAEMEKGQWDAQFFLHKQRWAGSRQNGSAELEFDHASLQFRRLGEEMEGPWPINHLTAYKKERGLL